MRFIPVRVIAVLLNALLLLSSCAPDADDPTGVENRSQMLKNSPQTPKHIRKVYPPGLEHSMIAQEISAQVQGKTSMSTLYIPPMIPAPPMPPGILTVAGVAPQGSPGPTIGFAVVELVLQHFGACSPPVVDISDDEIPGSNPYFSIQWVPYDDGTCVALRNETTTMPVAPDPQPGIRSGQTNPQMNHVPLARRTRIVLRHWYYGVVQTAYLTLQAGVFVVPVYFHDVGETPMGLDAMVARRVRVGHVFWDMPTSYPGEGDINSIWKQANVQFHLVSFGTDWHMLDPGQQSDINETNCFFLWDGPTPLYNVSGAVDLYATEDIGGPGSGHQGWGQYAGCYPRGHIAVKKNNLEGTTNVLGSSQLIAHEFGHYLGALSHDDTSADLMNLCACDFYVTPAHQNLMRTRIYWEVYATSSQDYHKHL